MKKSILIIMLCAMQGACAHYDHGRLGHGPMLSYDELGTEISITRIVLEEDVDAAAADAP